MIFKLNENETVELKYSFRSGIYFEQIAKKSLDLSNISTDDFVTLFYCVVIASLQKAKKPIIDMLSFLDCIDDYNDGEKCLVEFSNWYIEQIKTQYEVLSDVDDKPVKDTGKKKTN